MLLLRQHEMEAIMKLHEETEPFRKTFRRCTLTRPAAGLQDAPPSFFLTHIMKTEQTDSPGLTSTTGEGSPWEEAGLNAKVPKGLATGYQERERRGRMLENAAAE